MALAREARTAQQQLPRMPKGPFLGDDLEPESRLGLAVSSPLGSEGLEGSPLLSLGPSGRRLTALSVLCGEQKPLYSIFDSVFFCSITYIFLHGMFIVSLNSNLHR